MPTPDAELRTDRPRVLKLALLGGRGKMGQTVAQLAPQRGFEVRLALDIDENPSGGGITRQNFQNVDVAVDFTTPAAAVDNIRRVAALGCNLVVGTTGWHDRLDEVRKIIQSSGVGMVYAANFSIGVQLFYRAARALAEVFRSFSMYEPYLIEAHHRTKKDAPSGTALEIKRQIQPCLSGRPIPLASIRAGYIPGTHEFGFDSEADTLLLRHTARGRQGFAEGALYAARWIVGKKGLFNFSDILSA